MNSDNLNANNQHDNLRMDKKYKGMILDGRVYIAVKDEHYFRLCERCDVEGTGLCGKGTLGAALCNAFTMHYNIPVRFRFSQRLTDTLACI